LRFAVTTDEFDRRVREAMARNRDWFGGVEPPVNVEAVEKVEYKLGCVLPSQYKHFALTFGGGYFGGANISTLDETSDWYVLARPTVKIDGKNMLIVSDDEAGGYYGFVFDNDGFEPRVAYVNPDDSGSREDAAPSFFEFIEKYAVNV